MIDQPVLDMDSLQAWLPEHATSYAAARPFPHIVLDDVLTPDAFARAVMEFPGIKDEFWRGYLHVNEVKYCNVHPDTWSAGLQVSGWTLQYFTSLTWRYPRQNSSLMPGNSMTALAKASGVSTSSSTMCGNGRAAA